MSIEQSILKSIKLLTFEQKGELLRHIQQLVDMNKRDALDKDLDAYMSNKDNKIFKECPQGYHIPKDIVVPEELVDDICKSVRWLYSSRYPPFKNEYLIPYKIVKFSADGLEFRNIHVINAHRSDGRRGVIPVEIFKKRAIYGQVTYNLNKIL